jgi:glutamyl/glutaminyl-tRNA synthetase
MLENSAVNYVRIEDTNPENIYAPAYELIKKRSSLAFEGKAKVFIQSDRMLFIRIR